MSFVAANKQDFADLLDLNESCVPHVNSISLRHLDDFMAQAFCFSKLCDEQGRLAGFVIALQPGKAYQSVNYRWFERHYESFLYIDRIMVHPAFRRQGIASRIYELLEIEASSAGLPRLCCEVNILPPNPQSQKLHFELGFRSVGTQSTEGGTKEVDLLVKPLAEITNPLLQGPLGG